MNDAVEAAVNDILSRFDSNKNQPAFLHHEGGHHPYKFLLPREPKLYGL
jgi:hypothetical protein